MTNGSAVGGEDRRARGSDDNVPSPEVQGTWPAIKLANIQREIAGAIATDALTVELTAEELAGERISGVYRVDADDTVITPNLLAERHDDTVVQRDGGVQRDELVARNAQLERLDAEKTKLLRMVAHDLRNPLGVVLGYAKMLESDAASLSLEDVRRIARALDRTGTFMRRLVDDLVDLASIEAGAVHMRPVETDAVELATHCVAVQEVLASSKSIGIAVRAADRVPPIEVDRERFQLALGNLLSNAVKYSPRGSQVRVHVYAENDDVLFDVIDEGRGIEPELLPRIFEPFAGQGLPGTAGEKSTGLGLAIAKEMVDAHGGQLAVSSARGCGSTFTVRVPAARTPKAAQLR